MTKRIHSKISLFIMVVLFLIGLFFTIYDSPKTEASTWLLSGGTITWDNNQFLNETFWNDDPSDDDIIKALYGSGDEGSIYTRNWTGWDGTQCSGFDMEVIETGSLPEHLSDNAIYVLTGETATTDVVIHGGTCSSVISKYISGTTIDNDIYIYAIFSMDGENSILDNLTLDGTGSHVTNEQGIYSNSKNLTINKVNIYNVTQVGIRIQGASNVSLYNGSIATNEGDGHGIEIRNESHDCIISNMNIYNGIYGIMTVASENVFINNSQIYNNYDGLSVHFSGSIAINNTQIYNNTVGIDMRGTGTNVVVNNSQIYNNTLGVGVYYASSDNIFNDIEVYNNGEGISLFEGTENFYYGNVQVFGNKNDTTGSGILIPGYPGDYPSLDLSTGDLITTGTNLFRNYITNPIDSNNNSLNEWSESLNAIVGYKPPHMPNSYFNRTTTKYSYGKDILAQAAPILYSGEELVYSHDYDPTKYIGSNVTRITGDLLGIPDLATGVDFTVTGISDSILVTNYSLFGTIVTDITGITLGESSEIAFLTGDGEKRIITQVLGDLYYATHFQKSSTLEMYSPEQVILISPASGTVFATGEINLVRTGLDDELTGYVYEVISGGVVIQSGFTTTTGVAISLPSELTDDQYERRVYAIDLFNNTGERSETWGFTIDTIPPNQVVLVSPASGTVFHTGTISFLWESLFDVETGSYYIEFLAGGTPIYNTTLQATGSTISNAPDGTYERRVYAINGFGFTGERSETWSFTVDTTTGCASRWDNDNFITGDFRNNDPTDGNIICALYGSGEGDMTAYTQHWSGWDGTQCNRGGMQVIHTGDLPLSLLSHTIYVLNEPTDIVSSYVYVDDCTAVVSSNATGTTMRSDVVLDIPTKGTFNVNSKQYVIFDNISINGTGGGIVPSHNENENGIYLNKSTNTTIHSGDIYNNHMGINSRDSSYMKVNDVKIYNNSSNAIWGYNSNNIIVENIVSYSNFNGIHFSHGATNNTITDSIFYGNNRGIYLGTTSSNTRISNCLSYNNTHGISLNASTNNVLHNCQSYNNTDNGIRMYDTTNNVLNNIQSYNNGSHGIYMASSATDNIFNNFNVYNNNAYGIYLLSSSSSNIFHKIYSYNNTNSGIYLDVTANGNKYYGDNRFTIAGTTGNIVSGSTLDMTGLGWLDGSITLRTVSRDYITNPSNTTGDYLLSWSGTLANLIGRKTSYLSPTEKYSYGSGIFTQIQPVLYSGIEIVVSGSFEENKYIGSSVIKRTGDTQTVPEYTKYTTISLTGLSTDPVIDSYSLLGHLNYFVLDENINTLTGVELTTGDGTKFIINQLLGDDYYATHFQKNTFLDQTPPAQVILISPVSGTVFATGNVNIAWSGSFDTGAGLSGYVYEVSIDSGFSSVLYSGFTTATGLALLDLSEGTYYWRVYALDNVENIVAWSTIRNFSISLCNNGYVDSGESCDQGIANSSTGACSTSCEWNTPSCSLGVSPGTGYAPLTGTYSISNVDTGWMQFDWIDYGDGSTGGTDTGTLEYTHIYSSTGVYTGILQVSNRYNTSITGQCEVSIESVIYEYCGDGIIQSPNSSGDIEICDGELGCDLDCAREAATCNISASPSTGDVPFSTNITIDPIDPWIEFVSLDFGNGTIINSGDGLFTGQMEYTGTYLSSGVYTVYLGVYNVGNPGAKYYYCETTITGNARCGNEILEGDESCDQGIANSSTGACSTSCEWNTPSCSLGVSPGTGYAPLTGTYSISNVDTGWMQFDWIDYGDGSTGATDTGTLEYTHIYSSTGVYTGILQVSNRYNTSITGQCEVSIEAISPLCVAISWGPDTNTTCSPNTFIQTSNCGTTRTTTGTRNCGGGGGGVVRDNCCENSGMPGANEDCIDDSPSYYDNTCISPLGHGSAGKMCKYDDEDYINRGPFTDTEHHWGYNYIEILRKSCLHRGRGAAEGIWEYEPDGYITKAEVMKTVIKILGMEENDFDIQDEDTRYPYVDVFADVPSTHRFSWYAEYGYIRGLTNGMYTLTDSGRQFTPDEYITRNEAIKRIMMVYTMVNNEEINVNTPTIFSDLKITDPYYTYVRMAEEYDFVVGVLQPDGSRMFEGTRPITRAEFAKIVTKPFNGLLFEYTPEE